MSGGVLLLHVDAKSVERNEAYGSFSAANQKIVLIREYRRQLTEKSC